MNGLWPHQVPSKEPEESDKSGEDSTVSQCVEIYGRHSLLKIEKQRSDFKGERKDWEFVFT